MPELDRLSPDCWRDIFGNQHPVALEVGPGRGEFLCAAAAARPEWNFFAIEHSHSRTREIEARLSREALSNARVICADAGCVLPTLPDASLAAIFIQFPDPWWKRRHQKRRLWTPAFVAHLGRALALGAELELLTDVESTFELACRHFAAEPGLHPLELGLLDRHVTSFARKALRRGGVIYRAAYRRV